MRPSRSDALVIHTSQPTIGLTPSLARGLVELHQAEDVGEVGERQRRHAVGGGRGDGIVDAHRCRRRSSIRCAGAGGRTRGRSCRARVTMGIYSALASGLVFPCPVSRIAAARGGARSIDALAALRPARDATAAVATAVRPPQCLLRRESRCRRPHQDVGPVRAFRAISPGLRGRMRERRAERKTRRASSPTASTAPDGRTASRSAGSAERRALAA